MITIDPHAGSNRFFRLFPKGTAELQVCDYADFSFPGYGPDGPIVVGIEHKTMPDAINSIMSGRLVGEQLPKLINNTGFCYLIIQGRYRRNFQNNLLQVYNYKQKRFVNNSSSTDWGRFAGTIATIESKTPVIVKFTETDDDSVDVIMNLYNYWQKKWDSHTSHLKNYYGIPFNNKQPVSFAAKVLSIIPGVGWKRAVKIVEYYKPGEILNKLTWAMYGRDIKWDSIPTIGKSTANKINQYLRQQGQL